MCRHENSLAHSNAQSWPSTSQVSIVRAGKRLRTITAQDEIKLAKFYQSKMQKLCKELMRAFGFKPKVQGTALTFFKRFYLGCSMLDHDPKNIMVTCIYLACKVQCSCPRPGNLAWSQCCSCTFLILCPTLATCRLHY